MKAVISNRIYLEVTQEYKDFLDKELTYTIASYNPTDPPIVIKNMSRIRADLVSTVSYTHLTLPTSDLV